MVYRKKARLSFKMFLSCVPKRTSFMEEVPPIKEDGQCSMFIFHKDKFDRKREEFFKTYPVWYALAKVLKRKEVN